MRLEFHRIYPGSVVEMPSKGMVIESRIDSSDACGLVLVAVVDEEDEGDDEDGEEG